MIIDQMALTCMFAESIRSESEKRFTIVGTYNDTVYFDRFPTYFPISLLIQVEPAPEENTPITLVLSKDNHEIVNATLPSPKQDRKSTFPKVNLTVAGIIIPVEEGDTFHAKVQIGDSLLMAVGQLTVLKTPEKDSREIMKISDLPLAP